MAAIFDRAMFLAAGLIDAGVPCVVDVADAAGNVPCVLIPPPRVDFTAKELQWRVVVLGPGPGTASSWQSIDDLLTLLAEQLPLETADPGLYVLPNGEPGGNAAYIATFTDSLI